MDRWSALVACTWWVHGIFVGIVLYFVVWRGVQDLYFEEMRVFQAGIRREYVSME